MSAIRAMVRDEAAVGGLIARDVAADQVGSFAVHECIDREEHHEWTVTHTGSGFAIVRQLPSYRSAVWCAEQLQPLADWEFSDPNEAKNTDRFNAETMTKIRAVVKEASR